MESQGSLDRFLRNRAPAFLGLVGTRAAVVLNGGIGLVLTAMGVGLIIGSLFTGEVQMGLSSIGPLFGGGVNLWVSRLMRKRGSQMHPTGVKLSEEARAFLHRLMRQTFGWRYAWAGWEAGGWGHRHVFGHRGRLIRSVLAPSGDEAEQKHAQPFLHPEAFDVLERAAQHYNRIQGSIAALPPGAGGALARLRPAIQVAADETIADALHQAALIQQYPEGCSAAKAVAEQRVMELREAADRVEAAGSREPASALRATTLRTMDAVLDDLRLEDMARSELQSSADATDLESRT